MSLYVSEGQVNRIVGLTDDEGRGLLQFLFKHAATLEFTYRHTYSVDDLVFWDTRACQHIALADYVQDPNTPRLMHRLTVLGKESGHFYDANAARVLVPSARAQLRYECARSTLTSHQQTRGPYRKRRHKNMSLPLTGIKVLDLTRALAGPYASMILADLGADVIKLESAPDGDLIRSWGTKVRGESTYNLATNRNKRGVLLNYRAPLVIEAVRTMATNCDVLLENFRPGVVEKMGLGYEQVRLTNPRLIFGSISGFGRNGARSDEPGFDVTLQALSGVMSINGAPDGDPLRMGVPLGDIGAGMWLALGVVAAVLQREATGRGQRVDTSLLLHLTGSLCN